MAAFLRFHQNLGIETGGASSSGKRIRPANVLPEAAP
jgi:hypothetical protein